MEIKIKFNPPIATKSENIENMAEKANLKLMKKETIQPVSSPLSISKENKYQQLNDALGEAYQELDQLVGLEEVKKLLVEVQAFHEIQKRRAKAQLLSEPTVLHAIFKGNPGTGKTTVARLLGKMLKEMEILPKGHLVEVERADLVGEYIGHTAQKTREQIKKALGGILFIDEAYSLARGDNKDFGREAVEVLIKAMEDHKDNLVVILAGYNKEMDFFLNSNPGLKSRFPLHIDFPDYDTVELLEIADHMYQAKQYILNPNAKTNMEKVLLRLRKESPDTYGNARMVRNIVEASLRAQAVRLMHCPENTKDALMRIESEDVLAAISKMPKPSAENPVNDNIMPIRSAM